MGDIDYTILPEHMRGGMQRYIEQHIEPGGFLRAVLENDLVMTFFRADDVSAEYMLNIVRFVYGQIPTRCWGSSEAVEKWLDEGYQKWRMMEDDE